MGHAPSGRGPDPGIVPLRACATQGVGSGLRREVSGRVLHHLCGSAAWSAHFARVASLHFRAPLLQPSPSGRGPEGAVGRPGNRPLSPPAREGTGGGAKLPLPGASASTCAPGFRG
ncbi:hypothetical protein GCM10010381_16910 [Streptomyces xantholiticus]|nr:hypothetical protein GCM10010381_16910 [Streptomyces xantholiticus]